MKKFLLTIAMVALGFAANAQDGTLNVGANIALPIGDSSNAYSFSYGGEVNYLFNLAEDFDLGASFSYIQYIGKEENGIDFPSVAFLPVAAAGRYNLSEKFVVGADLGFAIGVDEGNDGGFYYRPMVGYKVMDNITLQATYSGISSDGATVSNIGLGAYYSF